MFFWVTCKVYMVHFRLMKVMSFTVHSVPCILSKCNIKLSLKALRFFSLLTFHAFYKGVQVNSISLFSVPVLDGQQKVINLMNNNYRVRFLGSFKFFKMPVPSVWSLVYIIIVLILWLFATNKTLKGIAIVLCSFIVRGLVCLFGRDLGHLCHSKVSLLLHCPRANILCHSV